MSRDRRRRPPYHRRDRLGFHCTMWLMAFGAIMAYAVFGASHANATPVTYPIDVCSSLRAHVPVASIENELRGWGLSETAAGWYTGNAVRLLCPDMIGYVSGQLV